jgi:SAM-dependent methyltransferase
MGIVPDMPHADDLQALQAPHTTLLAQALAYAAVPGAMLALDIGCGTGAKAAWLADTLAPGGSVIGIDHDRVVLRQVNDARPLCAEAQALPIQSGCADTVWLVALIGLLDDPSAALAEARRVLRVGGRLVLVEATTCWIRRRMWPEALAALLPENLAVAPADDLGLERTTMLQSCGFDTVGLRAYLLEPPGLQAEAASLPLLAWSDLEPLLVEAPTESLGQAGLAAEAAAELELAPILFVTRATASAT